MPVINQSAVADARTTFESLVSNALENARASNAYQSIASMVTPSGSIAFEYTMAGATPAWALWDDERDSGGFRKYSIRVPQTKYQKSILLDRQDVVYDQDGSTGRALSSFVGADVAAIYDQLAFAELNGNPTCIDGGDLLSATHSFGSGGGTWDNITSDALNFDTFNTGVETMMDLDDENGEPLNLMPSVLVVATNLRRTAKEIVQAEDRPISVGTAGAINAAGIGATGITNVYRADNWTLVVTPRLTSSKWVMIDPRFPPIGIVQWRGPETVVVDDMTADRRVREDKFFYGVEADIATCGLQPWGIYGNL